MVRKWTVCCRMQKVAWEEEEFGNMWECYHTQGVGCLGCSSQKQNKNKNESKEFYLLVASEEGGGFIVKALPSSREI